MKKGLFLIIIASVLPALSVSLFADSALWKSAPVNGDWNSANNWTPLTVPNGPADTATFGSSSQTAVSLSANTEVNGVIFAGNSAFTLSVGPTLTLTLSGAGIANDSGLTQNFVTNGNTVASGTLHFTNTATVGSLVTITNNGAAVNMSVGGVTHFSNNATAGNATFINNAPTAQVSVSPGYTFFSDNASADHGIFIMNGGAVSSAPGGETDFSGNATADHGTFTINGGTTFQSSGGVMQFADNASAGHGIFTVSGANLSSGGRGTIIFNNSSTAANAMFTANPTTGTGGDGSFIAFYDNSTAGSAMFVNNGCSSSAQFGEGGAVWFEDNSAAGDATLVNNGSDGTDNLGATTGFIENATAGNATLIANGGANGGFGGRIVFYGDSTGGTARVEVFGNGRLDITNHSLGTVTVGSIEGTGNVFLGRNNLAVGSNNLSTTFSGVIQDPDFDGDTAGGSLTKTGAGTLVLSGNSTYTGSTTVNSGALIVNGSLTSAVTVNGGAFGGSGSIRALTVNSGGTLSPGNSPGILNVVGNLTLTLGATYLVDLNGTALGTQYDQTNVTGAVNLGSATLALSLGFAPAAGAQFTIINNDGGDGVTGTFSGLPEGSTIVASGQAFTISYHAGDGNDVVLTAQAIPEPATALLLLIVAPILGAGRRRCNLLSRHPRL